MTKLLSFAEMETNQLDTVSCLTVALVVGNYPGSSRQGLLAHRVSLVFKSYMPGVGQISAIRHLC